MSDREQVEQELAVNATRDLYDGILCGGFDDQDVLREIRKLLAEARTQWLEEAGKVINDAAIPLNAAKARMALKHGLIGALRTAFQGGKQ